MICNLSYNVTNNKITYLMRQSKAFQQNRWKQKIISFFLFFFLNSTSSAATAHTNGLFGRKVQ